jgi:NhaA family Na+:H+ antiporter
MKRTPPIARVSSAIASSFQAFARTEALGGIALLGATLVALVWANSQWADSYAHLLEAPISIGGEGWALTKTVHHWINDGLMSVFFLLVGLEIKRELLVGELASVRQAALPVAAALGGMVVPAAIFLLFNAGGAGARGWGIPMATDIAFALGVLALLGPRVPVGLKVFLAAFAIADDMGAVIVIALFYASGVSVTALGLAIGIVAALVCLNAAKITAVAPYIVLGICLWLAVLASGLHATIAVVVLAFTIPARTRYNAADFSSRSRELLRQFDETETGDLMIITSKGQQEAIHGLQVASHNVQGPLLRLEHALHGTVAFVIMPIFALANAGVPLTDVGRFLTSPIATGVAAGLLLGKPLGITLFSWLATRFFGATLPTGVSIKSIFAVSWIGGIGFTMALFVGSLALPAADAAAAAKLGILGGSALAGTIGYMMLRRQVSAGPVPLPGS